MYHYIVTILKISLLLQAASADANFCDDTPVLRYESGNLTCKFQGLLGCPVSWYRNNETDLTTNSSSYQLDRANLSTEAEYKCSSRSGGSLSNPINVQVPPRDVSLDRVQLRNEETVFLEFFQLGPVTAAIDNIGGWITFYHERYCYFDYASDYVEFSNCDPLSIQKSFSNVTLAINDGRLGLTLTRSPTAASTESFVVSMAVHIPWYDNGSENFETQVEVNLLPLPATTPPPTTPTPCEESVATFQVILSLTLNGEEQCPEINTIHLMRALSDVQISCLDISDQPTLNCDTSTLAFELSLSGTSENALYQALKSIELAPGVMVSEVELRVENSSNSPTTKTPPNPPFMKILVFMVLALIALLLMILVGLLCYRYCCRQRHPCRTFPEGPDRRITLPALHNPGVPNDYQNIPPRDQVTMIDVGDSDSQTSYEDQQSYPEQTESYGAKPVTALTKLNPKRT